MKQGTFSLYCHLPKVYTVVFHFCGILENENFSVLTADHWLPWNEGQGKRTGVQRGTWKPLRVIDIFTVLIVVMVLQDVYVIQSL